MTTSEQDEYFMRLAIAEAEKASQEGEVPVGCVITLDGEIISSAYNLRENSQNALYHAEILAIGEACEKINFWRLCGCEMFVTLEPCAMCYGAAVNARIKRIVYGADDKKAGVLGSIVDLTEYKFNHTIEITKNVLSKECGDLLSDFFKKLRENKV